MIKKLIPLALFLLFTSCVNEGVGSSEPSSSNPENAEMQFESTEANPSEASFESSETKATEHFESEETSSQTFESTETPQGEFNEEGSLGQTQTSSGSTGLVGIWTEVSVVDTETGEDIMEEEEATFLEFTAEGLVFFNSVDTYSNTVNAIIVQEYSLTPGKITLTPNRYHYLDGSEWMTSYTDSEPKSSEITISANQFVVNYNSYEYTYIPATRTILKEPPVDQE